MTGGLVQLITYGTQDIFLIGNPEITFFKIVYRRYTFFSMESKNEQFNGVIDFNEEITTRLSTSADLAHKMYLNIELPKINIKNPKPSNANENVNINNSIKITKKTALDTFDEYSGFIISAINIINTKSKSENITSSLINSAITLFFNTGSNSVNFQNAKRSIKTLNSVMINGINAPKITSEEIILKTNIELKINNIETSNITDKEKIIKIKKMINNKEITEDLTNLTDSQKISFVEKTIDLVNLIKICKMINISKTIKNETIKIHKRYFDEFKTASDNLIKAKKIANNNNINFSWIKKLGHFIIERVEVEIGGTVIDRHFGDWLNIWHELSRNSDLDKIYNKMIGDVPEMTTYNNEPKPSYNLYIPLQFWFCRNNGLSLPLIAMRYNSVIIRVRLRKLEELIIHDYIGDDINDLININNISLSVDYIYLARNERRKFAQSIHEYLIEQTQIRKFNGLVNPKETLEINFEHPCKEIIWHSRTSNNIKNNNWSEYGIINGKKNTIKFGLMEFNGYERFKQLDGNYFNYVQPFQHHSNTPVDGINVYSFSLRPEEHQPTGSSNFSYITISNLHLTFEDNYYNMVTKNKDDINVTVYTINYNILRVMAGQAGLAFTL